jgi:hypothetical protein
MNINTNNFIDVIKKATMNLSIETVRLNFTKDGKIKSKMTTSSHDAIVILDIDNNVLDENSEYELNFSEPSKNLIPLLKLFGEQSKIKINDTKIYISDGNQNTKIFFCSPRIVSIFDREFADDFDYFYETEISDIWNEITNIKKIGQRFGKIYFTVKDEQLFIESTDKSNRYSNVLNYKLSDVDASDLEMAINYKNFMNLISIISNNPENFILKLSYDQESERGLITIISKDKSEKYFIQTCEL